MSTISGTINHSITVAGSYASPLTIASTGTVDNNGAGDAVYGSAAGITVVNKGGVTATGIGAYGGFNGIALAGDNSTVDNQGRITAAGQGIAFYAANAVISNSGTVASNHWGVETRGVTTLTNSGTIFANSQAVQLFSYGGASTVTNTGSIGGSNGIGIGKGAGTVTNSGTVTGTYGTAIILGLGGAVTNNAAGLISQAVGAYATVLISGAAGNVVNAGTISGYTGIQFSGTYNSTVTDSGTIIGTGGTAIAFSGGNDLLKFTPSTTVKIEGMVDGGSGTNTLEFASATSTGTLTGAGANFVNFGNGTIDAGASWVLAGSNTFGSSVTLTDSGSLTVSGTLTNAGTLNAPGTSTALSIANGGVVSNTAAGAITGGNNAITASGTVNVSNLGSIAGTTLNGIALVSGTIVNGATNNAAALVAGRTSGIAASGTATVVNYATITASSTAGIGVTLASGSVANGASGDTVAMISGAFYGVRVGTGQISNYGTLTGNVGARFNATGTIINHAGALIVGTSVGAIANGASDTVSNLGTIRATSGNGVVASGNGVVIVNGSSGSTSGLISGGARGVVLQANGSNTLFNYGTITGPIGIYDNGAGGTLLATVVNAGTIIGTGGTAMSSGALGNSNLLLRFVPGNSFIQGTVSGERNGVGVLQFASGASAGTLTGSNAAFINFQTASVDAAASWVFAGTNTLGTNTTLTNAGTLTLDSTTTLAISGTLVDTGTLTNAGTITGTGRFIVDPTTFTNTGYVGIALTLAGGSVLDNTSTGTVKVGSGDAVYGTGVAAVVINAGTISSAIGGLGVDLRSRGTITNTGKIVGSGGTAISFGGTGANLLIVERGYSFGGRIVGSASASNTLELLGSASAPVSANYNGLSLTNFGTVEFAPGADYVTLKITDNVTLPGTISGFTASHDVIDLTALSDAGNDATASLDTLTNILTVVGDNGSVQLQLESED